MSKNSAVKILDLDNLPTSQPQRQITLGGKSYAVQDMTVEMFIDAQQAAKRLEGETDILKQLDETIAAIMRAVPDVPEAELRKLTFEKLSVVGAFIRGMFDPDQADVEAAVAAATAESGEGAGEAKK
ncbi:hypothetical protein [Burkholderia contaminans]|uniref:Phage tail assembly protein n=1 Tax=Burkholderia contaminans TaxID=488447 RepID=A0A3N8S5C3_9BURK|nr:hypothetical protein [Burkholderia contaminans]RQT26053.1 hypothetical protein DF037_20405 [Burkholderia contaminans]